MGAFSDDDYVLDLDRKGNLPPHLRLRWQSNGGFQTNPLHAAEAAVFFRRLAVTAIIFGLVGLVIYYLPNLAQAGETLVLVGMGAGIFCSFVSLRLTRRVGRFISDLERLSIAISARTGYEKNVAGVLALTDEELEQHATESLIELASLVVANKRKEDVERLTAEGSSARAKLCERIQIFLSFGLASASPGTYEDLAEKRMAQQDPVALAELVKPTN